MAIQHRRARDHRDKYNINQIQLVSIRSAVYTQALPECSTTLNQHPRNHSQSYPSRLNGRLSWYQP